MLAEEVDLRRILLKFEALSNAGTERMAVDGFELAKYQAVRVRKIVDKSEDRLFDTNLSTNSVR